MGNVNKKYILEFIVFILLIIFYTVFFTGTKKQPSGLTIDQINDMYHTSFPDSIKTTSIGEIIDKSLFHKKESVHEVVLVTDYYFCEFEMTKGDKTFSSLKNEYLKHEFEIKVEDIPIKVKQYNYARLNNESIYKPTYILTFEYQDTFFYITIRSMDDSLFTYEQNEAIKPEELNYLKDLIRDNVLGI